MNREEILSILADVHFAAIFMTERVFENTDAMSREELERRCNELDSKYDHIAEFIRKEV